MDFAGDAGGVRCWATVAAPQHERQGAAVV